MPAHQEAVIYCSEWKYVPGLVAKSDQSQRSTGAELSGMASRKAQGRGARGGLSLNCLRRGSFPPCSVFRRVWLRRRAASSLCLSMWTRSLRLIPPAGQPFAEGLSSATLVVYFNQAVFSVSASDITLGTIARDAVHRRRATVFRRPNRMAGAAPVWVLPSIPVSRIPLKIRPPRLDRFSLQWVVLEPR